MNGNIQDLNLDVEEEAKGMTDFAVLPEGEYKVVITESELKETKKGDGRGINVTMQIIEGEHEGRIVPQWFNIENPSEQAQKIGRAELASCCKAIGLLAPKDTTEMHDRPFGIKLGIDRKDPTKNRIKAYIALDEAPAQAAPEPPKHVAPHAAPAATAATARKPWQKK